MANEKQVAKELLQDSNWLDKIQGVMQDNVFSLFEKFYNGAHDLVYSSASLTAISIIVMFWLLDKLKNGYPTNQELFKAIKYIIILCFIFATLSSYGAYEGALYVLNIPVNMVKGVVGSMFQGQDFGAMITDALNQVENIRKMMWEYGKKEFSSGVNFLGFTIKNPIDALTSRIFTIFAMIPFWIFYVIFFILLVGITAVILISTFMAYLILSTMPIIIPFLIYRGFLPYLWSWYKLYLSYALIAPLSFIALNLAINPIMKLANYENNIGDLFVKQFEYLLTGTITCITAYYIIKKIPNWINAVLGTQMESGAGGVGGALMTGAIAGKTFLGGLTAKSMGKSFLGGAMSGLGRATGGSAGARIANIGAGATANAMKDMGKGVGKIYDTYKKFRGGYAVP